MKKKTLFLSVILFSFFACQNGNIIENPDYEVKDAGIFTISKIEKSDSVTKLWVQVNFTPGSWVRFREDQTFIRPSGTEEKFAATAIENGEFDKELYMPASGDTLFILSFPPIDRTIGKIDFLHYESTVWGISFDGKKSKKYDAQDKTNEKRLKALLRSDARKEPDPENAFKSGGKARFAGYIKRYDPRLDISGIIYASNEFTREDIPYAFKPDSTGWFEIEFDLNAPSQPFVVFGKERFLPYFEPGLTTALVFDREDCYFADLYESRGQAFKNSSFTGATGRLNNELYGLENISIAWFDTEFKDFEALKSYMTSAKDSVMQLLDDKFKQKDYLPLTQQIAKNNNLLRYGYFILDKMNRFLYKTVQEGNRTIRYRVDSIAPDMYDFLREIPDEPITAISGEFSSFINRYEYCDLLRSSYSSHLQVRLDDHFFEAGFYERKPDLEKYVELLEEEEKYGLIPPDRIKKLVNESWENLTVKYPDLPARATAYDRIKGCEASAENLQKKGLQAGFFYETAIVRSLDGYFDYQDCDKATARIFIDYIKSNLLTDSLLRDEAENVYVKNFVNTGYELPDGEAADLFRELIAPYKGKIILVDFWAVWCAPCLAGIEEFKQAREKYKDSQEIAILYICGDSPQDRYEQNVQKHGLYNTVLLNDEQYNLMRQLFKFNGIPRYALIDSDGKVITNDFNYTHIFNSNTQSSTVDLEKDIEKYKKKTGSE
ncbi:MAG: TlpA family protein disulfide reductase [Tannerella sp.]|jgi:thiol-disulfide isomerase/thioredoxin|nr:TlpA family protein disulfide reductase [Tannerella sp.]